MNKILSLLSVILLISCNNASKSSDDSGNETADDNMTTYVFPETGVSISLEDDHVFDENKNLLSVDGGIFISVPTIVDKSFSEIKKGLNDAGLNPEFRKIKGVDIAVFMVPSEGMTSVFAFADNGDNVISIGGGCIEGNEDKVKKILLSTKYSK